MQGWHQLKEVVTPNAKREAVVHACGANGLSERRACKVLEIDWYSMHDSSVWPDDADLSEGYSGFRSATPPVRFSPYLRDFSTRRPMVLPNCIN